MLAVVGLARRVERVEQLKSKVSASKAGQLHAYKCDVSKEEDILSAFTWIVTKFGGVDVLVNNVGLMKPGIVVWCTREAFQSMKSRGVAGHVILINSIGGHHVPNIPGVLLNIYPSSKFAITALTEVLPQEFQTEGTKSKLQ